MAIDQKFHKKPSNELTLKLLHAFGYKGFNDDKTFTKQDMITYNTLEKIKEFQSELEAFYIPCKRTHIFSNLDEKKCLTILRHFLKHNGHHLDYYETMKNNKKIMVYKIISIEKFKLKVLKKKISQDENIQFIVSFGKK
jgi:hypothetical protein